MSTYFESDDVDAFTTAAIGEPGSRTFYLQIRSQGRHITMKCEKQQVAALSQYIRQLLADAPDVKERPLDDAMQMSTPSDVEFVVGTVDFIDQENGRRAVGMVDGAKKRTLQQELLVVQLRLELAGEIGRAHV